jgi:hypothetical protein
MGSDFLSLFGGHISRRGVCCPLTGRESEVIEEFGYGMCIPTQWSLSGDTPLLVKEIERSSYHYHVQNGLSSCGTDGMIS